MPILARLREALRWGPPSTGTAPAPTLARELRAGGTTADAYARRGRSAGRLYGDLTDRQARDLARRHPMRARATIDAAERICRHEFDLLGSGPFVPDDPDRPSLDGYRAIDWYLDPVRRLRFPRGVPYKSWNLYEMRPGFADIKYPWELARCQHWVTLGQAFRLSGDERFAREIARQLADFVEANPVGIGINWTCTMDVALRAVSWALALEMVRGSGALDPAFWSSAQTALFDHGVFIRANLENTYEVTSNHFLSNVVGLWFLSAMFADTKTAGEWNAFSRLALEQEIDVQVRPDGADFESSVPYHRLVTELFLGCARLADLNGEPLSEHYRSRVRDMTAYLAGVLRPDGLMPQVGDADDGRLHILSGYGTTSPQDPRHLLGPAGVIFDVPEWVALSGDAGQWEAVWWGLDPDRVVPASVSVPGGTRLFPDAGLAVMRSSGGTYLVATNGIVGTNGFGNHKHNDQLSFEYHPHGIPLIVDPGSYVYTSDPDARNLFRSTASHNTLRIDAVEQNEMKPEWLFRLFETSNAEHVSFDDGADVAEYVGRHHGYERLPEPVTHERAFRLLRTSDSLLIIDRLRGQGEHDVVWHFHLAPGVSVQPSDGPLLTLVAGGRAWGLYFPPELTMAIETAGYSPSYGVRVPCTAITLSGRLRADAERRWEFRIVPATAA